MIFGVAFRLRRSILGFTDQRVSIMNEVRTLTLTLTLGLALGLALGLTLTLI